MLVVVIVFLLVLLFWCYGLLYQNDLRVPTVNIKRYKKVLVIFPHPDDEVLTTGGLLPKLHDAGADTTLAVFTKGEKGECKFAIKTGQCLADIREAEAKRSSEILKVSQLIQHDLGDGKLRERREEVVKHVRQLLAERFNLVVTYDLAGLYGHEDHITLSEVVTEIARKEFPETELWYASYPKKILDMMKLPTHMAKDPHFLERRVLPTHRVFVGLGVINKVRSLYTHKSQYDSFRNGIPFKQIPMWFFVSQTVYEYFYKVR